MPCQNRNSSCAAFLRLRKTSNALLCEERCAPALFLVRYSHAVTGGLRTRRKEQREHQKKSRQQAGLHGWRWVGGGRGATEGRRKDCSGRPRVLKCVQDARVYHVAAGVDC